MVCRAGLKNFTGRWLVGRLIADSSLGPNVKFVSRLWLAPLHRHRERPTAGSLASPYKRAQLLRCYFCRPAKASQSVPWPRGQSAPALARSRSLILRHSAVVNEARLASRRKAINVQPSNHPRLSENAGAPIPVSLLISLLFPGFLSVIRKLESRKEWV